jgi:hypothetical protein
MLNPEYAHLRLRRSRGQAVGGVLFAAFALLVGGVLLWAATENWWLTGVISVTATGAGVALGRWALIRRMRRGEQIELGNDGLSATQILLVTGVGTYLASRTFASRTLESLVYGFFGLVGTLFAGLFVYLAISGRPKDPTTPGTEDSPDAPVTPS